MIILPDMRNGAVNDLGARLGFHGPPHLRDERFGAWLYEHFYRFKCHERKIAFYG